jgi:hypothetical protein
MVGGVAAGAAIRAFPFRVYSFPTDIKIVSATEFPAWMYAAESYLFNPQSREELGRMMGIVEKQQRDNVEISCRGRVVRNAFPDDAPIPSEMLFSDVDLAQVDWA